MNEPFRFYLRVRYGECDAQKVVFNTRYGDYIDIAITEFLRALGYGAEMVSGELDFQLVKQTKEWRASARYDDVLVASVSTTRVGNTSFALATEFRVAGRDAVICTSETVYVLVDQRTLTKRAIPEDLRRRLEIGAPGVSVDHAGHLAAVEAPR
ncbi:MAG: acyl-CoA thioesterase [Panacagrimonas sp.]